MFVQKHKQPPDTQRKKNQMQTQTWCRLSDRNGSHGKSTKRVHIFAFMVVFSYRRHGSKNNQMNAEAWQGKWSLSLIANRTKQSYHSIDKAYSHGEQVKQKLRQLESNTQWKLSGRLKNGSGYCESNTLHANVLHHFIV